MEYRTLPDRNLADYVTISPESTGGWYNDDITLTPEDGCEVGDTPAAIGTGAVTISQETRTEGSKKTIYLKDSDENIYQTEFSYKLDKTSPAVDLTDMTVENGTKNLWDWIIGKTGMRIKLPASSITESLSGIAEISYTATPENGGAEKSGAISEKGGIYEIILDEEFTGTIKLTAKDKAGNITQVTLPAENGKVIAEGSAPVVRITPPDTAKPNENGWYNTQVALTVTVTDSRGGDGTTITSGGIAEIIWKEGKDGTEQSVADLAGNAPVYEKEFTIYVNNDGTHTYYVKAVDNAGNESGWQMVTVKVDTGKPEFSGSITVTNPAAGHTFPEKWTVEKEATEKEPGREHKICETCGTKIYRTIDPSGTSADPYAGKIEKEVEVLSGAPDTVLNNSGEELAQSILTSEEIAEVENGTDAKIWLEVAPDLDIAEEEKAQVQKAAEESVGAGAEVTYFDVSLFKQVGNREKTIIHEPGRPVSVTIVIPEDIRNKDVLMVRNYQIIRLHDGKTDIIEGTYKEDSAEFTFETDKFSAYAICYKDKPKQATPATPTPGGIEEPVLQSVQDESGQTGNEIEERKDLSILLATGKQKGRDGIKLTWLKWKDALGYEVYWSYCDGRKNYRKQKTVNAAAKREYTHTGLKENRAYKYYIAAYKMIDGKKKYVAKSPVIHVAMKYEERTNAKKITANKAKVILSLTNKNNKKTFKIRVKVKKEDSRKKLLNHAARLRYYTDDKEVAAVSRTGKITAQGKGKCTVYVIANNGVCKKITVTVK